MYENVCNMSNDSSFQVVTFDSAGTRGHEMVCKQFFGASESS